MPTTARASRYILDVEQELGRRPGVGRMPRSSRTCRSSKLTCRGGCPERAMMARPTDERAVGVLLRASRPDFFRAARHPTLAGRTFAADRDEAAGRAQPACCRAVLRSVWTRRSAGPHRDSRRRFVARRTGHGPRCRVRHTRLAGDAHEPSDLRAASEWPMASLRAHRPRRNEPDAARRTCRTSCGVCDRRSPISRPEARHHHDRRRKPRAAHIIDVPVRRIRGDWRSRSPPQGSSA